MSRPKILDLFCGAGGAAMGYHRAGFDVVGVDINPQPRYPFAFVQDDALEVLEQIASQADPCANWDRENPYFPFGFEAIHASPPCQAYSVSTASLRLGGKKYPALVAATRDRLSAAGVPWVIENVPGAPIRPDYRLCGCMFGLPGLRRERWFETSWRGFDLRQPCHHPDPIVTVIGHGPNQHSSYRYTPGPEWTRLKQAAMGIDWMNREELGEAIPPAYTQFVGEQLLAHLALERAA